MQPVLVDYLNGLEGVREVRHSATVANTLSDFNSLIGYISVGIILILFLIKNKINIIPTEIYPIKLLKSESVFATVAE